MPRQRTPEQAELTPRRATMRATPLGKESGNADLIRMFTRPTSTTPTPASFGPTRLARLPPGTRLVHRASRPQQCPDAVGQAFGSVAIGGRRRHRWAPRTLTHAGRPPFGHATHQFSLRPGANVPPCTGANQRPVISWIAVSAVPNASISASASAGNNDMSTRCATRSTSLGRRREPIECGSFGLSAEPGRPVGHHNNTAP